MLRFFMKGLKNAMILQVQVLILEVRFLVKEMLFVVCVEVEANYCWDQHGRIRFERLVKKLKGAQEFHNALCKYAIEIGF